jgi:hypothetical protein
MQLGRSGTRAGAGALRGSSGSSGGIGTRGAATLACRAAATEAQAATKKKVSMVSLGCPKNTVDGAPQLAPHTHSPAPLPRRPTHPPTHPPGHAGEVLLGDLARAGFEVVTEHEDADAIVVNTCAFVEDAKSESLEVCARGRGRWGGGFAWGAQLAGGDGWWVGGRAGRQGAGRNAPWGGRLGGPREQQQQQQQQPYRCLPACLPACRSAPPAPQPPPPPPPPTTSPQAIMGASQLNEDGRRRKIVITGCLAQRYSEQLAADLPEADLVVCACTRPPRPCCIRGGQRCPKALRSGACTSTSTSTVHAAAPCQVQGLAGAAPGGGAGQRAMGRPLLLPLPGPPGRAVGAPLPPLHRWPACLPAGWRRWASRTTATWPPAWARAWACSPPSPRRSRARRRPAWPARPAGCRCAAPAPRPGAASAAAAPAHALAAHRGPAIAAQPPEQGPGASLH